MSYHNDHRVRGADRHRELPLTVCVYGDEDNPDDPTETLIIPHKFVVCPTCEGKGTHVNPSVDSDGLTARDFDDDPDFKRDYMSGMYDVQCYECKGQRVVPVVDTAKCPPEALRLYLQQEEDLADMEAERRAEQRWGY